MADFINCQRCSKPRPETVKKCPYCKSTTMQKVVEVLSAIIQIAVTFFSKNKYQTSGLPDRQQVETVFVTDPKEDIVKSIFNPSIQSMQIMKALLYLGKADGQLREDEITIIAAFLIYSQPEHQQTDPIYLISKIREIKEFTPEGYHAFIADLDNSSLINMEILMKKIFGTQAKNHPYEDILLSDLQKAIATS